MGSGIENCPFQKSQAVFVLDVGFVFEIYVGVFCAFLLDVSNTQQLYFVFLLEFEFPAKFLSNMRYMLKASDKQIIHTHTRVINENYCWKKLSANR